MATAVVELNEAAATQKDAARQKLLNEVRLGLLLTELGANYDPEAIARFQDPVQRQSAYNRDRGLFNLRLPGGVSANANLVKYTPFRIVVEDARPVLYDDGRLVGELHFPKFHPLGEAILSDGNKLRSIGNITAEGGFMVAYSSECALKDNGEDCLFCAINERAKDSTLNRVVLKSPRQVAEAYSIARQAGEANHFRITGGFVPERREVEYYLDVADAIKEKYESFYGVTIIGAPADLSILNLYKEAGFTNISHNLEVWDRNLFAAIAPGEEKRNGGWRHWVESLEYAVDIFGKGNVHTNFVGGLGPLESTIEGLEYLASRGIVPHFSAFRPEKGTGLEGYRSPDHNWHWQLLDRGTDIFKRYGFNTLQLYSGPASAPYHGQVFQIKNGEFEGETLEQWRFPELSKN